jgi:diacylglycerol O-acyltransferase / wax synthase
MAARMNDAEAIMWTVESDPFLRSDFMNVTLLDRPPDAARLRAAIGRSITAFPPLRQRVARPPLGLAPPEWVDDPDFDLGYHVRRVAVLPPGGLRQLLDLAAALATAPLDRARPLWELTVVEGLVGGRTAALQRVHHSLTDGIGGMKLLRMLFDRTPGEPGTGGAATLDPHVWRHPEIFSPADTPRGPLEGWLGPVPPGDLDGDPPWPALDRLASPLGGVGSALAYRFGQGLAAARKGVELASTLPLCTADELRLLAERARRTARSVADQMVVSGGALSPLMVGRSLARHFETLSLDLAAVRRAGHLLGGGRNDVFVAGVTGAFLAYHEQMGVPCEALRMAVPVSLRAGPGPLGRNHFALARVVVPLGPKDPAERLLRTRDVLRAVAAEPGMSLAESLAGLVSLLPPPLLVPALRAQARTVDFATSIVPGLRSPRYLAGARVEGSWPMGPRLGCGVNLTLLACDDQLHLGINLDPAAITDPPAFLSCLHTSFEDLLEAG